MFCIRLLFCTFFLLSVPTGLLAHELPDSDTLSRLCANLADRMEEDLLAHEMDSPLPLQGVCVYLFLPRGVKNAAEIRTEDVSVRELLEATTKEALIDRPAIFGQVLERDHRWKRFVLAEHKNDLALDEENMPQIGHALGARWVVTGNYWFEQGTFVVRSKIFHAEKARTVALDTANTGFFDLYRSEAMIGFPLVAGMLLVVPGGLLLRRKKHRNTRQASSAQIVKTRDPEKMRHVFAEESKTLSPDELVALENLLKPVRCMTFECQGIRYVLAPGPEQGIGRGPDWVFSLADPHISRSGRACMHVVNGHTQLSSLKENQPFNAQGDCVLPMVDEERISLSPISTARGTSAPGWSRLHVTDGPGEGTIWIMIWGQASVGSGPGCALSIPGLPEECGYIVWTGDRPLWVPVSDDQWPWPDITPGAPEAILAHQDRFQLGPVRFQITLA